MNGKGQLFRLCEHSKHCSQSLNLQHEVKRGKAGGKFCKNAPGYVDMLRACQSIDGIDAFSTSLGNDGQRQAAQADQDSYPGGASSSIEPFSSASSGSFS